jgi:hypothetical protein
MLTIDNWYADKFNIFLVFLLAVKREINFLIFLSFQLLIIYLLHFGAMTFNDNFTNCVFAEAAPVWKRILSLQF